MDIKLLGPSDHAVLADVAQTLQLALSGSRYGYFIKDGKQYQVIGQLSRSNRDEPVDLSTIYVRNGAGELIQLDNVITVSESSSPPQLFRYNRYVAATVSERWLARSNPLED